MSIQLEIEQARKLGEQPPSNESMTCEWIILPLLHATGYERNQIHSRTPDPSRKLPDYTILPNTDHTWYLEAKTWSRSLDNDQDLVQAIGYAHSAGCRWVVLSNGREWRLFDDHIPGILPAERLVASASLDEPDELERFLQACSPESVQSGGLESFAIKTRIEKVLTTQIARTDSELVKAISSVLKSKYGIVGVRPKDIVQCLTSRLDRQNQDVPKVAPEGRKPIAPSSLTVVQDGGKGSDETLSLAAWHERVRERGYKEVAYSKPTSVAFPGQASATVRNWRDVTRCVLEWAIRTAPLPPLPFEAGGRSKRAFLNRTPTHPRGDEMKSFLELPTDSGTIYVHTNLSAAGFVRELEPLLRAMRLDTSSVAFTLSRPSE